VVLKSRQVSIWEEQSIDGEYRGSSGEDQARQGKTKQESDDTALDFMACVGEEFANHDDDGRTDQLEAPRTIPSVG
jgi:hypothetical protein